ncbi:hypothetical protein TrST_g6462 [Triparma strigata]|uniref:Sarcosine dehydrogenase n=1 Tax=Triparma strigata TaxID=1606541 RepID=A0A9W6ZMA7_9STRA|nr:hypothetical protein TrST_g6462 [Triparma strigata]
MTKSADVVVVGGGSLGMSALYHLQKKGLSCVLLERNQLTSGTTWHSAGMLWRLRPSDIDIELHSYTRQMCMQLEEETGFASWTENGGLFIANNKERFEEYKRLAETAKYFGIESNILEPNQINDVHPLLRTDDTVGAMYSPSDGTIDPTGIVNAYAKAAKKLGAKIYEKTGVASVKTTPSSNPQTPNASVVQAITTTAGHTIETPVVVNACGAWANELTSMVGCKIPLLAMKHAMVVTEKMEGMHPSLPNVRDHDLSIYLKTQGDAMAIGGYEQNPEFCELDEKFEFGLFNLDWDTFGQNLEGHIQRCPAIESVGIKSTVCGPESFTPDHKPLVGPQPGVHGFFHACGFNSMGMMLGGGIGRELAEWVVTGSADVDLFSFDVARFHRDNLGDPKWVKDRTHESYAKTYAIVFPGDESLAGRTTPSVRKSGGFEDTAAAGCVFQNRHGYERPGYFIGGDVAPLEYDYYGAYEEEGAWRLLEESSPASIAKHKENKYERVIEGDLTFGVPESFDAVAEECHACRNGVAVFDQSYFGNFYLEGPEALDAVQKLAGFDVEAKEDGSVTYTTMCNSKGGVEADLTVLRVNEDQFYFSAGGQTCSKDWWWIERNIQDMDCKLRDVSDETTLLSLQGPKSRTLLQKLVEDPAQIDDEALEFSHGKKIIVAGHECLVLRLTFVGELGFELHVPSHCASDVYKAVFAAGAELGDGVPVRNAGYKCIDSLSAEKGYRHYHADLSNADTPMEAGIGFAVLPKLKAGVDFIGSGALNKKREEGIQRKLVCLTVEHDEDGSPVIFNGMETIIRDGEVLGLVRSTAYGHSVEKTIAFGYIDKWEGCKKGITNKQLQEEGTTWQIGDRGKVWDATLHIKSVFDPKGERISGIY